ncbi:hypothetical protein TWF481_003121 [Arthrobotrys musiformis]|uniref:Protein SSH4 n=1 Tax=Arthrobotrys musiformis TaxID=47236 RepID=A0AAV9VR62_9PEZI
MAETIRNIASTIPNRIYMILDALDECKDRREKDILGCLKLSLTKTVRIIISARDTIKIYEELGTAGYNFKDIQDRIESTGPPSARMIEIEKENNAHDVREYLKYEVSRVLNRIIDPREAYFSSKMGKIVETVYKKASGDFTRARLIIAHLQQPSKLPLEQKVDTLPDSIGDIYTSSLEALTPSQQELVITALKWIVWGVSGIHVIEISDHYREIYEGVSKFDETILESTAPSGDRSDSEVSGIFDDESDSLPFREENLGPEVKEVIYHLRDSGRDFFRYDPMTGLVTVDISIREWITKDSASQLSTTLSSAIHGFDRYRDNNGFTVFKFTLTPSFVKYGDILSPLFDEREAQMGLALNILHTLNNKAFQERYMPWKPYWSSETMKYPGPKYRSRYEIDHWHDHLAVIQKWWTEGSINDPRWADLLKELDRFMQPGNWYRWNIQRRPEPDLRWPNFINTPTTVACWYNFSNPGRYRSSTRAKTVELFLRYFQKPIHFACQHGLYVMLDYILDRAANPAQTTDDEAAGSHEGGSKYLPSKFTAIRQLYASGWDFARWRDEGFWVLPVLPFEESLKLLTSVFQGRYHNWKNWKLQNLVYDILSDWDSETRAIWFASQAPRDKLGDIGGVLEDKDKTAAMVEESKEQRDGDTDRLASAWNDILRKKCKDRTLTSHTWDAPDGLNRTPLYIGALDSRVRKSLLTWGANINATIYKGNSVPIIIHLLQAIGSVSESEKPLLLQAIRDLLNEGVNVDARYYTGSSALHYAANTQDLSLFRQICQIKTWNILDAADDGRTPMHWLFSKRPLKSNIEKVYGIFMMMIRMSPTPSGVVNAQDHKSESPLAQVVRQGFFEGIKWLADQKADVHGESHRGKNCFHFLAQYRKDDEIVKSMARSLIDLGVDWKKPDKKRRTPLFLAVERGNAALAHFLAEIYDQNGSEAKDHQNQFASCNGKGENILHLLAYLPYSQSLFNSIMKMAGGVVDPYHRAAKAPFRRPLEVAIDNFNVEVARYILSSGSYICGAGKSGYNEVDRCCNALMTDDGKHPEAIKGIKLILGLLFRYCPTDAICALRYYIFEPKNLFFFEKEQQEATSTLNLFSPDIHGWGAADILKAMNNDRFYKYLRKGVYDVTVGEHKTPTKFVIGALSDGSYIDSSSEGLKFTLGKENCSRDTGDANYRTLTYAHLEHEVPGGTKTGNGSSMVYFAEHPIPLTKKTTYFELTFNLTGASGSTKVSAKKSPYFSVGIRSKLHAPIHGKGNQLGVECDLQGVVRTLFEQRGNISVSSKGWKTKAQSHSEEQHPFRMMLEHGSHVVGCGTNPLEGKIFFTVNGRMLPHHFPTMKAQQFPIVTLQNCQELVDGFEANFGRTNFAFEDANVTGWEWDGVVPEPSGVEAYRLESRRGFTVWEVFHEAE